MVILACGCGKKESDKITFEMPAKGAIEDVIPTVEGLTVPKNQNLLTGIGDLTEEAIGKRPVAVMINNVKAALPQYGIAQADVIFEMPVEGDLTRLMALYADYTQMPDICAIRSCRYYYPAVAKGFDAFYVHWGMGRSDAEIRKNFLKFRRSFSCQGEYIITLRWQWPEGSTCSHSEHRS